MCDDGQGAKNKSRKWSPSEITALNIEGRRRVNRGLSILQSMGELIGLRQPLGRARDIRKRGREPWRPGGTKCWWSN